MKTSNQNLCVSADYNTSCCADHLQKKAILLFPCIWSMKFAAIYLLLVFLSRSTSRNRQLILLRNYFQFSNKELKIYCKYCLLIEKTCGNWWRCQRFSLLVFYFTKQEKQKFKVQRIFGRVHSGNGMLVVCSI